MDSDKEVIVITIPEVRINDINVDISSLDYIFENKKSETAMVSEEAYKKCKEDVKIKVNKEDAIYDYAAENAKNVVKALVEPFIQQLDEEYSLEIH